MTEMAPPMTVKVGCCGFPMAKAEYCRRFAVVEIQQTFYNLPRVQTAEKWRREALALQSRSGQADFEFTLKAWLLITHEPSSPTYRRLRRPIPDAEKNLYGSFRPTEPVLKAQECEGRSCDQAETSVPDRNQRVELSALVGGLLPAGNEAGDLVPTLRKVL